MHRGPTARFSEFLTPDSFAMTSSVVVYTRSAKPRSPSKCRSSRTNSVRALSILPDSAQTPQSRADRHNSREILPMTSSMMSFPTSSNLRHSSLCFLVVRSFIQCRMYLFVVLVIRRVIGKGGTFMSPSLASRGKTVRHLMISSLDGAFLTHGRRQWRRLYLILYMSSTVVRTR